MRGHWASGAWGAAAAAEEYPLRLWPRGTALQALPAPAAYLGEIARSPGKATSNSAVAKRDSIKKFMDPGAD